MRSVLQDWVQELTFMQQAVLISAIRAPDGLHKAHPAKLLWRWLRRCTLIASFEGRVIETSDEPGGGNFTGPVEDIQQAMKDYFLHVDSVPHHAHLHLMHAAEIIGYKHPVSWKRQWWRNFYVEAANDMHLGPESCESMDHRLGDVESQWRETERFPAPDQKLEPQCVCCGAPPWEHQDMAGTCSRCGQECDFVRKS